MQLKMSSGKWWPLCIELNALKWGNNPTRAWSLSLLSAAIEWIHSLSQHQFPLVMLTAGRLPQSVTQYDHCFGYCYPMTHIGSHIINQDKEKSFPRTQPISSRFYSKYIADTTIPFLLSRTPGQDKNNGHVKSEVIGLVESNFGVPLNIST